ncbi:MAG: chorismate synthase, partial [Lachnospiraceae bacterium]|nr:chorismate synthase [Lachnospiraceae bacterium]
DRSFSMDPTDEIKMLKTKTFPVIDDEKGNAMVKAIEAAREDSDSVGGVISTAVTGVPAGLGEPWFDSLESEISHAVFSLGGVKGIEFGLGFKSAGLRGSEFNDPIRMKDGKAVTLTNNNGGINGGISNGMPILFNTAVKPTPSVARPQKTVDVLKNEECELLIKGRHDPAIIRRICPVIDCVTAFVMADMLSLRYGTDVLLKGF